MGVGEHERAATSQGFGAQIFCSLRARTGQNGPGWAINKLGFWCTTIVEHSGKNGREWAEARTSYCEPLRASVSERQRATSSHMQRALNHARAHLSQPGRAWAKKNGPFSPEKRQKCGRREPPRAGQVGPLRAIEFLVGMAFPHRSRHHISLIILVGIRMHFCI